MSPAVWFGLASALCYGTADFVSHFAGRDTGVLRTMLYGQSALALLLSAAMLATGTMPHATVAQWLLLLGLDATVLLGTVCLYRALAIGNLAIVPPVTACYGIVAALLSWSAGEHLSTRALSGLALAVTGGVLAAIPAAGDAPPSRNASLGTLLAAIAALCYGAGLWAQGRITVPVFGELTTLWSYYLLGAILLAAFALVTRADARPPSRRQAPAVFATAALAIGGYTALILGQHTGAVAIATALSSVASAVTVVLARVILRQHVAAHGWVGLILLVCGLSILRLA